MRIFFLIKKSNKTVTYGNGMFRYGFCNSISMNTGYKRYDLTSSKNTGKIIAKANEGPTMSKLKAKAGPKIPEISKG
jgi:hypothetical protein